MGFDPFAPTRSYPLDNDHPKAADHHGCLAILLDPFSTARTRSLFEAAGGLTGRHCLDVGAGVGGRYARWLADQVGPTGHVTALDVKPRDIPAHPNLTVIAQDLSGDECIDGEFDFIHARLTLAHLPQRRDILTRLIRALRPGGWILIEDWATTDTDRVLHAPDLEAAELFTFYQETVSRRVFAASGTDPGWARQIHSALRTQGIDQVHTVIHAESWTGGGPGCHLIGLTVEQLRPHLLAVGLTERELDRVQTLLSDPEFVVASFPLYSTSGRLPRP